jgi:phosphate transport system substrate-binding protein
VDFGATDVPMSNDELRQARTRILHVPTAIGAVGVTYQLPTLKRPLRLSGEVMADLFLGRITRWKDARLQALNPDAVLPALPVKVVHRIDGSGTTYIYTEFLSAVSRTWAAGPGPGRRVEWPVGVAGTGNEGVAGEVKATEGAIGYVEVVYARSPGPSMMAAT